MCLLIKEKESVLKLQNLLNGFKNIPLDPCIFSNDPGHHCWRKIENLKHCCVLSGLQFPLHCLGDFFDEFLNP